jgi:large subunit ribosomal protein L15
MTNLSSLKPKPGSRPAHFRWGIGEGSGGGQTAGKGMKGQRSRSGDGKMPGFEGGQTPLLRRVPKRGFTNGPFKIVYQVVSVGDLSRVFKNQTEITLDAMKVHGLISGRLPVKVLGDGEVSRGYKVSAHAFSASAKAKLEKAGGSAEALKKK